MTTRDVWTRWLPCGTWRGVVSEQRVDPSPRFADYDVDDDVDDWRSIALLIGGVDWLPTVVARIPGGTIEVRVVLAAEGECPSGWGIAGPVTAGLEGRYGYLGVHGYDMTAEVAQHVASNVTLTIEGRRLLTLALSQEVVWLARPWRRHPPGTRISVTPRDADRLRRAGYVIGCSE